MQVEEQQQKKLSAITHSPYYGCTVRVLSKARVSYEGVLDGISANKDRIYLKDVHVNANLGTSPDRNKPTDTLEKSSTSDTLNAVMIDHLTTDIHTYEHVCLNVRDIKELRLIQLPSTFNDSKAKLRAIDPCLVDIRLSSSDDYERQSNGSPTNPSVRAPIARQRRGESLGSTGDNLLVSSSSNESSSPSYDRRRSSENVADESNDESIDEQIEKFNRLTTSNSSAKPVTLLAKKILPKKIERRTDIPAIVSSNGNQSASQQVIDDSTRTNDTTMTNNNNTTSTMKKDSIRKESPVRVTITSQLNPNAIPFYAQQRKLPAVQNPSFTFYERPRFRPRLPTVVSPDRAQTVPYGRNPVSNNNQQQRPPHHPQQPNSYQRFVPLRQMAMKKNVTQNSSPRTNTRPNRAPPPPIAKYRFHSTNSLNKRTYPQQQQQQQQHQKQKPSNNIHGPELMRQTSLPPENQLFLIPAGQSNLFQQRNNPIHQSTTSIHSTASLPYHYGSSVDHNQRLTPVSVGEPIGSRRNQRTCSMASSCSSVSVDIGPHSIIQFDSSSPKVLPSFDEQYDFEKANEEFRRYLELEELVTRRTSSHCSMGSSTDINASQQQAQAHSYKKDISFFDHISCTATTGTAVGYTEMDETEKNLETFGDDALLLASKSTDNEWQI